MNMNVKEIKEHYADCHVEDYGDYKTISINKTDYDWLIKQAERSDAIVSKLEPMLIGQVATGYFIDLNSFKEWLEDR